MKKRCTKCKQLKSLSEFHKDKYKSDGYNSQCKQCVSEYQMKHYRDRWEAKYKMPYNLIDINYKEYIRRMKLWEKENM